MAYQLKNPGEQRFHYNIINVKKEKIEIIYDRKHYLGTVNGRSW